MPDLVSHYRDAGFSDEEITAHIGGMRQQYRDAGFSDDEIDAHLGMPKTPKEVPQPFLDRFMEGKTVGQQKIGALLKAVGGGAVHGFGEEPAGPSEPNFKFLQELGVFAKDGVEPLFPQKMAWSTMAGIETLLRLPGAAMGGIAGAAKGVAEAAGSGAGESLERDVFQMLETIGIVAGNGGQQFARIKSGPAGRVDAETIGRLPKGEDFSDAGRAIGNGDTTPTMEAKLADLYERKGLHPAEVAHDAQNDPTIAQSILSVDKADLPATYGPRVSFEKTYTEEGEGISRGWTNMGYALKDAEGRQIATASISVRGDTATISNIYAGDKNPVLMNENERVAAVAQARNTIGPTMLREALRQFTEQNPQITRITGERISGARLGGGYEPEIQGATVEQDILTEKQPSTASAAAVQPPAYTDAEKQILSKISIDEKSPERKLTLDRLYTNFLDKLYPISKAVKEADLADLTAEENPYQLARLMSGYAGKADHFLNRGTFDFTTYENNGRSLKSILGPVSNDLNGFRAYAAAARALELEGRGIKSGFDFGGPAVSGIPPVAPGMTRLYRGEGAEQGRAAFAGSGMTGGWFTTDPAKAKLYGKVSYVDVSRDDLKHFAQGHGGSDEFITDNPSFRQRSKPYADGAPSAPPLISSGLDAARTVVVEGRGKYEKPFRELIDYQNRVSQYLRDSGVLSDAGYKAMIEANKMYVPFSRVMGLDPDARAIGGSSLQARNPVKAIKGSARDIVDPIESVVRNTFHMVEMAERNQVGTKLVDMLQRASESFPEAPAALKEASAPAENAAAMAEALGEVGIKKPDDLASTLAHASTPDREGTISILRDGKRETYSVDPELARAMKGLDAQSASLLERVLAFPASTLRAGAVATPEFWGRHVLRDFLYAATTFKDGVFHPVDMAKGFAGLVMKDEDYWNWLKGGGGNIASVGIDRRYLQQDLRKLTGQTGLVGRAWNVLADPEASMWEKSGAVGKLPFQAIGKFVLDPLRAMTEFAENASHLAAFKKTLRAGERAEPEATDLRSQIIRAAWVSRDTAVDAARMGANMRAYNMITAFANIKLQDTDRVVRALKDNPLGSFVKISGAVTVPSVLLWAANHNDPRYAEIPQWQKDMFWLVMTPDHIFRLPKPWAMGMIFGTLPERLLDQYVAEKPDAFKEYFKQLWATSGPDFLPTAAAPIVDQFANRSTFTNRTLVPAEQEKFLPEYQYTPYTTETTKALGQIVGAFPGMTQLKMDNSGFGGVARALTSPILMEHYLQAWTGNLGKYALQAADAGLRKSGVLPDPPMPASTLADIPVIKAFVVRYPSASAESIQSFYDAFAVNKSYFDTWMAKAKEGDAAAMQHIEAMGGPVMFAQLDEVRSTLFEHSQIIRDLYKNPDIPPDEKRQLIDTLYFSMIQVARGGNEALRQIRVRPPTP